MKTIKCYAIDDDADFLQIIKSHVSKTPRLEWVGSATDPVKGLRKLLDNKEGIQLAFLDVQMEPLSGLELMRQLPKAIKVVLCTSYRDFACDAFELRAIDYLLKPVSFTRFLGSVAEVEAALQYEPTILSYTQDYHFFFVCVAHKSRRIMVRFDRIVFVKADGEVSHFHFSDGSTLAVSRRLGIVYQRLPKNPFARIHHSHIINRDFLVEIKNGKVLLQHPSGGVVELDIGGKKYAGDFYRWMDEHAFD